MELLWLIVNAPLAPITAKLPPEDRRSRFAVRRLLAALGYQETINFSFVDESWERDLAGNAEPIRLLNPIASQQSVMRTSLIGSLVDNIKYNHARKVPRIRVFNKIDYLQDAEAQAERIAELQTARNALSRLAAACAKGSPPKDNRSVQVRTLGSKVAPDENSIHQIHGRRQGAEQCDHPDLNIPHQVAQCET